MQTQELGVRYVHVYKKVLHNTYICEMPHIDSKIPRYKLFVRESNEDS